MKHLSTLLVIALFAHSCSILKKTPKEPEWVTTKSGLQYKIIKKGNGNMPQKGDKVTVHYTGKLTNDTIFDSSHKRNQPFSFKLGVGQVIKGWDEGIGLLHVGDSAILRIPDSLGYGSRALPTIPANSTLIFEVELLSIKEAPKPYNVSGKDTITTESGLKYILVKENKEGKKAGYGDKVKVHYTGYLLDSTMFDSSVDRDQPFEFQLGKGTVIRGWDELFNILRTGEQARAILPPNLAYGERGIGPIPANSTLIFDAEFIDFTEQVKPPTFNVAGKDTITTQSGLKYIVVESKGSPVKADSGKQVAVHYAVYFEDGKLFETSYEGGDPLQFVLGKQMVIPGWEEGLSLMSMGDKYRLIIPSELAYGEQGSPPVIPPNATLVFDVELVLVSEPVQAPAQGGHEGHDHSDPNHKH